MIGVLMAEPNMSDTIKIVSGELAGDEQLPTLIEGSTE